QSAFTDVLPSHLISSLLIIAKSQGLRLRKRAGLHSHKPWLIRLDYKTSNRGSCSLPAFSFLLLRLSMDGRCPTHIQDWQKRTNRCSMPGQNIQNGKLSLSMS